MAYRTEFPEKEKEAIEGKTVYKISYLGCFELLKFHFFKKQGVTRLVKVFSGNQKQMERYVERYGLIAGKPFPGDFEWQASQ